ncbi:MAG: LysR family transcriptional regulator [Alphaproteobacteria bacterium]
MSLDWDDLKCFLAVAEAGSFRAAAVELGVQASSLTRRIDQLEHRVKARLFDRNQSGVRLTQEGLTILEDVRDMQDRFKAIQRKVVWKKKSSEGVVTLAATDGLGAFWIAPRLAQLRRIAPKTKINLKCAMEVPEVDRQSADIGLQYARPTTPDLIVAKVARIHIWPYASRHYAETYGLPRSIAELEHHRFVVQAAHQLDEAVLLRVLGVREFAELDAVRTNTSTAHLAMVSAGLGIGCLPTYLAATMPDLVPLDMGPDYSIDLHLAYRRSIGELPHVRRVIDWVKSIFDPRAHPLFGDELLIPQGPATPTVYRRDVFTLPPELLTNEISETRLRA